MEGGAFPQSGISWMPEVGTPPSLFCQLEDLLLRAEREIALIDRFLPCNFRQEAARLSAIFSTGTVALPRFDYSDRSMTGLASAAEKLAFVREQLSVLERESAWGWLALLMQQRADELNLELELVHARESSMMSSLSQARYALTGEECLSAKDLANRWLNETHLEPEVSESTVSVAFEFVVRARAEGLHAPIVEREISSIAAVGGECIYVQRGARAAPDEVARIWVHEVGAHLRPRLAARNAPPPFRVGTVQANEDEEGRALLLEERASLLNSVRRKELATRHLLAAAARESLEIVTVTAQELLKRGVPASIVAHATCRACRGGGLAREVIYLTSFQRVAAALSQTPKLELWMERGRISIAGARLLEEQMPLCLAATGMGQSDRV